VAAIVVVLAAFRRERRWRCRIFETDDGEAWNPQVAVDAFRNAIAVWNQSDGNRFDVWANRYIPGAGWGTAILLETDNAGRAGSPQVAVFTHRAGRRGLAPVERPPL